jgi:membrane protease YdiL (CAAX protease family)
MSDDSSSTDPEPAKLPASKPLIPWSPWLAIPFVVVVYFVSQIIAAVALAIWPAINRWSSGQTDDWLSSSIYAQFFYVLIAEGLVVLAVYQFLKWYRRDWKAIGLRRPKWRDVGLGLLIAPLYYLSYIVIVAAAGQLVPSLDVDQTQQLGFDPVGTWQLVVTFISLVILPPLVEEILMRGFLYTSLRKAMPVLGAALTTSAIFAAAHLQAGSGAPLLWVAAIDTFVLSLFLVWLREKTGSLWAGITLHALKNGIAFFALFIFATA